MYSKNETSILSASSKYIGLIQKEASFWVDERIVSQVVPNKNVSSEGLFKGD